MLYLKIGNATLNNTLDIIMASIDNHPLESVINNSNDLLELTKKNVEKYNGLKLLEKYGLYMGMAQILELQIKQILASKFNFTEDQLERLTMGQAIVKLEEKNVRDDLIGQLRKNSQNRNIMAHEFLANTYISIESGFNLESIVARDLDKYIVELENVILIWDCCVTNDSLILVGTTS